MPGDRIPGVLVIARGRSFCSELDEFFLFEELFLHSWGSLVGAVCKSKCNDQPHVIFPWVKGNVSVSVYLEGESFLVGRH